MVTVVSRSGLWEGKTNVSINFVYSWSSYLKVVPLQKGCFLPVVISKKLSL